MRDWTLLRAAAARVLDAVDVECDGATLARLLGVAEADAPRLAGAAPAPVPDVEFGAPGTLADALRHYDQGRFPEFLEAGLACLRSLVRDDLLMAARCAYAALAHWLRKARVPTDRREVCARVLNAGLELQQEMLHFPWRARDAAPLYYKLRALAFVLGDTRSLGLLDLAIGTLNINGRSRRKALFHHQVMRRGINTVNALGDSDILLHSSGMICFYYFVEGKFTRAINCAYSAMYMPDNALNFNYERMLYSYAALSAVHLGEYDVAVNMLHLAIERSRKREQWLDMSSLRAILALACLLGGHEDEAFEHIDGILGMRARPALTYADVLASRVLAYYHHLRGRDRASYVCYTIWQKKAQDKGLIHSNYISAPFVLELLAAYERAGFDPPGERSLDQELECCLASPSRLLHGVGLRVSAEKTAEERGGRDEAALERALESLAVFRACSASVEIAKTQILLARLYRARGDGARAGAAAAEAWAIHSHCGQPPWPDDMNALRDGHPAERPKDGESAVLRELFQAMRQQYAWETDEAFFRSLLYALLATFGAERGGVFRAEDGEPRLVADAGPVVVDRDAASRREDAAREALRRGRAVLRPSGAQTDAVKTPALLAVVADAEEQGRYVVCLEGGMRARMASALSEELFSLLEHYLAAEISIHLRRSSAWEDRIRSAASAAGHGPGPSETAILFRARCMRDLLRQVDMVAARDTTVLILGESGVGKELVARRLHERSGRSGEFVGVNLASTPDELFESEFYGHEKGSFTGARYQKRGLFELADKGTLFIDEAGDIPPRLQVKLLRVLQEKRFLRVGGTRTLTSDFRLVAATNRDLEAEVRAGRFREDLYYRLSVVPLRVPPLRERPEDVLFLAEHFLRFFAERHRVAVRPFDEAERAALTAHDWPGNVRELKNYVERCILLPDPARRPPPGPHPVFVPEASAPLPAARPEGLFTDMPTLAEVEERYFEYVYRRAEGKVGGKDGVAARLGISRTTAYALIGKLGLRERFDRRLVARRESPS